MIRPVTNSAQLTIRTTQAMPTAPTTMARAGDFMAQPPERANALMIAGLVCRRQRTDGVCIFTGEETKINDDPCRCGPEGHSGADRRGAGRAGTRAPGHSGRHPHAYARVFWQRAVYAGLDPHGWPPR